MQDPAPLSPAVTHAAQATPGGGMFATLVAAIGAAATALVLVLVPPLEGTVLTGYRDIGGVVTACTGNTTDAFMGAYYTPERCRELLLGDLVRHARDLTCIQLPPGRELAPHEKAALLSLVFNVGHGKAGVKDGLCELKRGGPSTIRRRAEAGDMAGACVAIEDWVFVKNRDCRAAENRRFCGGIVTRRAAERAMCEGRHIAVTGAAP